MSHPGHPGSPFGIKHIIMVCLALGVLFSFAILTGADLLNAGSDQGDCQASQFMIDWKVEKAERALIKYGGNQSVFFIMDKAGVGHSCEKQVVGNLTAEKPVVEQNGWLVMERYVGR